MPNHEPPEVDVPSRLSIVMLSWYILLWLELHDYVHKPMSAGLEGQKGNMKACSLQKAGQICSFPPRDSAGERELHS